MNGRNRISIAVLTENQDDVALIDSTLRDAGHAARCHWVSKPQLLGHTLAAEHVELIILNCARFPESVRQVVKLKHRFSPELPVIAIEEDASEAAIEAAMRAGACDLVSIAHKGRLHSVITRELRAFRIERALNSTIHSATEYKRQLNDYMQDSPNAIAFVQEGIITEVNGAWLELFRAASNDEVAGLPLMDNFEGESHAAVKGALNAVIAGKWQPGESLAAKSAIANEDGSDLRLEFEKIVLDDGPCIKVTIRQAAIRPEEPTKLVHDALKRDPTTLFFHRAQFLERLRKRLAKKPQSGLHVLAYVRIDSFSDIRDKVGIIDSEEVIAQFSEHLRKRMHPRDVAGRFEGISIMVLLERGSVRDAEVWGQQLCQHVSKQTFEVGDHSTQLTCTIGICPADEVFATLEDFVAATVGACRQGREAGGNSVFVSERASEDTRLQAFDAIWVQHLKAALMDNRFRLAQLPIAGLRSDGVEMYDLLVRMLDESGNSVLPSEFLPAAERNNMMKHIDRWMIKAAVDFCSGSEADRVFVRLSRQSILDQTMVAWMDREFDAAEFDCSRLVVQVRERDAAMHIKQTQVIVGSMRKMGVGFALEHFGLEQDRFQILDVLKPDYIKVDGELIHTLMSDASVQQRVETIVRAAAKRNIKSIAERVENANAMAVLFHIGLDFMQGHYVHEPEVVLQDRDTKKQTTLSELMAANAS